MACLISQKKNVTTTFLSIALLFCGGCKKSQQSAKIESKSASPTNVQQSASLQPKIEACSLVTKEDVATIQATTITDTRSSAGPYGKLIMSQCYYNATEPNKSVSLAVIQPDFGKGNSTAREYWEQIFGSFAQQSGDEAEEREKREKAASEAREEEERKIPPKKINGVGEQAYWSGNRVGGALYVLEKDVVVRVSVGGPDNEETKIAKSKSIAAKAVSRL